MNAKAHIPIITVLFLSLFLLNNGNMVSSQETTEPKEHIPFAHLTSSLVDGDGNIILAGNDGNSTLIFSKVSVEGDILWYLSMPINGPISIENDGLLNTTDDSIIVIGWTESEFLPTNENSFQPEYGGGGDAFVLRITENGKISWISYLGGNDLDFSFEASLDSEDNIVIIGQSYSSSNFPLLNEVDGNNADGSPEVFVTKINSQNGELIWSTYFGGSGDELAKGYVDSNDDIIFGGRTTGSLPAIDFSTAYQPLYGGGGNDLFAAKMTKDGQIAWATYFGGNDWESNGGWETDIDSEDNLIFTGGGAFPNFPTTSGSGFGGDLDTRVTKFSTTGELVFHETIGGQRIDNWGHGQTEIDGQDSIIRYAHTFSDDFPVTQDAFMPLGDLDGIRGDWDFPDSVRTNMTPTIVKFNKTGGLVFSTNYIQTQYDEAFWWDEDLLYIKFDSNDNLAIVADSNKSNSIFPTINSIQDSNHGKTDLIITKLDPHGDAIYSTYFGGNGYDELLEANFDHEDNLLVLGFTNSTDFPGIGLGSQVQGFDIFLSKIDPEGNLVWSILIGGEGTEDGSFSRFLTKSSNNMIITNDNDVIIIGRTTSKSLPGSDMVLEGGLQYGFITLIGSDGDIEWTNYIDNEFSIFQPQVELESPLQLVTMVVISSVAVGSLLYSAKWYWFKRRSYQYLMNDSISSIISPIFDSNPKLLYLFVGQTYIKDNYIKEEINAEVPLEIFTFKDFLHPVRLAVLKLLYDNQSMTTVDIKESVNISWEELHYNINFMKKKGYVTAEQEFIEGTIKTVVYPDANTVQNFQKLRDMLIDFLTTSPNMDKYLDHVLTIKNKEDYSETYPTN